LREAVNIPTRSGAEIAARRAASAKMRRYKGSSDARRRCHAMESLRGWLHEAIEIPMRSGTEIAARRAALAKLLGCEAISDARR
jgi:hypothetical protein